MEIEIHERWQRVAVERRGQGGAAGVGNLGVPEREHTELRQHTCVPKRTRQRRRRHEGGDALVAERAVHEYELLQRRQPAHGRREGHQTRITDAAAVQVEELEPRQGASAQGSLERRGACVAHIHADKV